MQLCLRSPVVNAPHESIHDTYRLHVTVGIRDISAAATIASGCGCSSGGAAWCVRPAVAAPGTDAGQDLVKNQAKGPHVGTLRAPAITYSGQRQN